MSKNILILPGAQKKAAFPTCCAPNSRAAREAGHTVQTIRVHELAWPTAWAASTARTTAESVSTRTAWPKS